LSRFYQTEKTNTLRFMIPHRVTQIYEKEVFAVCNLSVSL
jgi:hypothetical protein